ncbi:MAG: hypothetical protein Q7K39_02985 [Candidatus Magasanikbacteria bacterium]|nr:hypothetical protein [Candidatus Magasanikbacteria bacterium]
MDSKQKGLVFVLVLLVIVFGGGAVYFYRQYTAIKANPQKVVQDTVNDLVAQVGKLIALPEGETPTVATVIEPEKLKEQPFFAKAKAGDKVLIYTNARKAILYSVLENRILEVAPLTIGNEQGAAGAKPATAPARSETATSTQ